MNMRLLCDMDRNELVDGSTCDQLLSRLDKESEDEAGVRAHCLYSRAWLPERRWELFGDASDPTTPPFHKAKLGAELWCGPEHAHRVRFVRILRLAPPYQWRDLNGGTVIASWAELVPPADDGFRFAIHRRDKSKRGDNFRRISWSADGVDDERVSGFALSLRDVYLDLDEVAAVGATAVPGSSARASAVELARERRRERTSATHCALRDIAIELNGGTMPPGNKTDLARQALELARARGIDPGIGTAKEFVRAIINPMVLGMQNRKGK